MTATKAPHASPPISAHVMVCRCHGLPVYRQYEPDGLLRGRRYRDFCVTDMLDLGFDAALRRDDFELAQERKRREKCEK